MNEKIFGYVTCVLTDKGSAFPTAAYAVPPYTGEIDSSDIQGALNTVLSQQKQERVLVVTDSAAFCVLLLAMNRTLPKNKLVVLCGGTLHADDAMEEIIREEALLHTADGHEHFPLRQIDGSLHADEEGRLLLAGSEDGEPLFSADGTLWGCLPDPARYTEDRMLGRLTDCLGYLDLRDRAQTCHSILDLASEGLLPAPEDLLVFRSEDDVIAFLRTGAPVGYDLKALTGILYTVYFGHIPDEKDKLGMLIADRLANPEYPAWLFEDFTAAFSHTIFPGSKIHVPDEALLRNTIDRIMMAYAN